MQSVVATLGRAIPLVLWVSSAAAEEAPTPEELKRLEESLQTDAAEQAAQVPAESSVAAAVQSLNPDMALILDVAGAYFSQASPEQLGGHDPDHTGFTLQQLELHATASVDPFLRFETNIVFSLFGVEVEEAFATTLALPANLQARAGQFLTRFGRHNPTHPHAWSFIDQPLVFGKMFGSEGSRGLGVEVSWLSPLPWYAELVASTTGAQGECCARSFFGADDPGVRTPADLLYTLALKQFFPLSDDWSVLVGLSSQLGPNNTGNGNRTDVYGGDLYLRWRPVSSGARQSLSLQIEALARRRQAPGALLEDAGGYAQLVWEADKNWELGGRYEIVSGTHGDPLDPLWIASRPRYAAQLTYFPSHFSRLRAQASLDDVPWQKSPIWAGFLALEVTTGAHGAHAY